MIVLTASGKLYAWGSNRNGEAGAAEADRGIEVVWKPIEILKEVELTQGGKITSLACACQASFALTARGEVWAWGHNVLEGLGNRIHPTMVPLDSKAIKVLQLSIDTKTKTIFCWPHILVFRD